MNKKVVKIWKTLKRISFDIGLLAAVFGVAWFLPPEIMPELAKVGLMSIFMSKLIFVSAGIIHAHISRLLVFPYICFGTEKDWTNNLMIIVWYITIICAWARGG